MNRSPEHLYLPEQSGLELQKFWHNDVKITFLKKVDHWGKRQIKGLGWLDSIMEFIRESLGSITRSYRTSQNEPDTREAQTLRHVILSGYTSVRPRRNLKMQDISKRFKWNASYYSARKRWFYWKNGSCTVWRNFNCSRYSYEICCGISNLKQMTMYMNTAW